MKTGRAVPIGQLVTIFIMCCDFRCGDSADPHRAPSLLWGTVNLDKHTKGQKLTSRRPQSHKVFQPQDAKKTPKEQISERHSASKKWRSIKATEAKTHGDGVSWSGFLSSFSSVASAGLLLCVVKFFVCKSSSLMLRREVEVPSGKTGVSKARLRNKVGRGQRDNCRRHHRSRSEARDPRAPNGRCGTLGGRPGEEFEGRTEGIRFLRRAGEGQ